jgi:hypothetical protein
MRISQKISLAGIAAATTVLLAAVGCASAPHAAAPLAQVATTTPAASATPSATPAPPPLTGTASVTRRHPIAGAKAGISVITVPDARISVVVHVQAGNRTKTARADATGLHTFWFTLGSAPPGYRVKVDVRVSANGQKRSYRAWFTPRQRPPPPLPTPAPAPAPSQSAAPPPASCHPIASSGNCYEPGEFCPQADAGMTGVAGNGEAIICENNNGLRWEPA